jgi:hypothetical protein
VSGVVRVFINGTPVDVAPGTDVRTALRAHDPVLDRRVADGTAFVTDARGIEIDASQGLVAGSILRVVIRSRRGGDGPDGDA